MARSSSALPPVNPLVALPPRSVTVPSAEDLELAKDDALLQLRIGRSAHYYTVLVSVALLLDGFLVLSFAPNLSGAQSGAIRNAYFLILPIASGVYLSVFALRVKWEAFQLWPWELHFTTTVAAVALNLLILLFFLAAVFHVGPTANAPILPWFYPLALAGVSVALLSLVLTWKGWKRPQLLSLTAALLPVPLAFVVYVAIGNPLVSATALGVSLFVGAVLYQTSGSFLHLISSGTRTHERELITSGQSRMFQVADILRRKDEALRFREAALLKREADVENYDLTVRRQAQALEESRLQLESLEKDYQARGELLAHEQTDWGQKAAETNALRRAVEDQDLALKAREEELHRRHAALAEREQKVVLREGDQTRREYELTRRQFDLDERTKSLPDSESKLEERTHDLDRRTQEIAKKESELRLRESIVTAATGSALPSAEPAAAAALPESRLAHLQSVLDTQNQQLGRKARQLEALRAELDRREKEQTARVEELGKREAALEIRESEIAERRGSIEERARSTESSLQRQEERLREIERQKADVDARAVELTRREALAQQRDRTLQEELGRLTQSRAELDQKSRELAERAKAIEAAQDELTLRRQSLGRPLDEAVAVPPPGPLPTGGPVPVSQLPNGPEVPSRLTAASPPVAAAAPAATGGLLAVPKSRALDRLPTGTPRLDDLLLGGLPPRGHVMLVGDAFVGKEVLLYAFLAEGLKRGEPAVLITASRSPDEISEAFGVVLPQFREYEHLGMVAWIDASGSGNPSEANRVVVKGPADQAAILSALVSVAKQCEAGKTRQFRVGFLGLSTALANADAKQSTAFVQNVVGILKPRSALAMYALEGGTVEDAQLEALLSRMDGAILFRQERDRTFLSVKGMGDVQTHDWIEYRATNRALVVGSFALERIR